MSLSQATLSSVGWTNVVVNERYVHDVATHDELPAGTTGRFVRLSIDQTSCGELSAGYARSVLGGIARVFEVQIFGELITSSPTAAPTFGPTTVPTTSPTAVPTTSPTAIPTTMAPTAVPTTSPTAVPTAMPTTMAPTGAPTTLQPTPGPSSANSGASSSSPLGGGSNSILIVVIVALIVILVIVGAVYFKKSSKAGAIDSRNGVAFDNPL